MKTISTLFLLIGFAINAISQNDITWLSDYTDEVNAGSYTYQYSFKTVEGNNCKINIEASKKNSKGSIDLQAYEFYLSDIDMNNISFKPTGKYISVFLKTKKDQDFIRYFEDNTFEKYTDDIVIITDAVDKARGIMDAFKANIPNCKKEDISWNSTSEAINWLSENIGESVIGDKSIKQEFLKGDKEYLAKLKVEGEGYKEFDFNISDLSHDGIKLVVSGTTLKIAIPVKESKYYIRINTGSAITYDNDFSVVSSDIESARNILNAFQYLAANASVTRVKPANYNDALSLVKENLKEALLGSSTLSQSLIFDNSTSGITTFTATKTDSKAGETVSTYSWYMNEMLGEANLKASSKSVSINFSTKEKKKTVQLTRNGELQSYVSTVNIYVDDIELARELINALEYAQNDSDPGIVKHTSLSSASSWLQENVGKLSIGSTTYEQSMKSDAANQNMLKLDVTETIEGKGSSNYSYELYPEDIKKESIDLNISGKKLSVPLSTGDLKYIKKLDAGELSIFTSKTEVVFDDVKKARNFIAALNYVIDKSLLGKQTWKDENEVINYFSDNLISLTLSGTKIEQKFEKEEGGCKSTYTQTKTDSKGVSTEYGYEFMPSDLNPDACKIAVSGQKLSIQLITNNKQKLIKPYKNGESQNFGYSFEVYVQDVLIAKKMLDAFRTYAKACK